MKDEIVDLKTDNRSMGEPYRDLFHVDIEEVTKDLAKNKRKGPRGGVVEPFPVRLYRMLEATQKSGVSNVVSWQEHGRSFVLHQPAKFASEILPRYVQHFRSFKGDSVSSLPCLVSRFFRQTKLTSFHRQLSLYSFQRIIGGKDHGGYYHEMFLRGRPDIARVIVRTPVKGQSNVHLTVGDDPDFYSLPFCEEGKSKVKPATEEALECSAHTKRKDADPARKRRTFVQPPTPSFSTEEAQTGVGGTLFGFGVLPQWEVANLVGGFPGALAFQSFPQNPSLLNPLVSLQLLAAGNNQALRPVLPLGHDSNSAGTTIEQLKNPRKF
jgi:hypothetical protein